MEGESSFDLANIVFTPSNDEWCLLACPSPYPSPSSDLPPVQPSHMNIDPRQSAIAVAIQSWVPPDLSSSPTDPELVDNLRAVLQHSGLSEESPQEISTRWKRRKFMGAVVNAALPSMNPWELPGIMAGKQGRREKYYLTDYPQLGNFYFRDKLETPNGFWIHEDWNFTFDSITGLRCKKTYIWSTDGMKTNWIMNVYTVGNRNNYLMDDMALSHVFEASPDYNAKPKCPTSVQGRCTGKHHQEGINASTNTSFSSMPPGSSPMHHGPCRSRDPRLTSYMANLENLLLGDPDPDPDSSMDTENCCPARGVSPTDDRGKSHKRKKISDVWDYFTKIYACDLQGNVVTLAACNHCSKALNGSSSHGTSQLRRHTCPCKFRPVKAARMEKAHGTVNVLSS